MSAKKSPLRWAQPTWRAAAARSRRRRSRSRQRHVFSHRKALPEVTHIAGLASIEVEGGANALAHRGERGDTA